jgi:hypothetical protein
LSQAAAEQHITCEDMHPLKNFFVQIKHLQFLNSKGEKIPKLMHSHLSGVKGVVCFNMFVLNLVLRLASSGKHSL